MTQREHWDFSKGQTENFNHKNHDGYGDNVQQQEGKRGFLFIVEDAPGIADVIQSQHHGRELSAVISVDPGRSFDGIFVLCVVVRVCFMTGFFVILLLILADVLLKMTASAFYVDPLGELSAVFIGIGVFA